MWEGYGLKIYLKTFFFQNINMHAIYNTSGSSYIFGNNLSYILAQEQIIIIKKQIKTKIIISIT